MVLSYFNEFHILYFFTINVIFLVRHIAQKWIIKIECTGETNEDIKHRNEYMWFLLVDLQNGTLTIPFNEPPPSGPLTPLNKLLVSFY